MQKYEGFGPDAKVLLILLKDRRVKRSSFQTDYGINYNTAKAALERIEDAGLAAYEPIGDRRETVYYRLTEKGEKAAKMLADLDEFIRSD